MSLMLNFPILLSREPEDEALALSRIPSIVPGSWWCLLASKEGKMDHRDRARRMVRSEGDEYVHNHREADR